MQLLRRERLLSQLDCPVPLVVLEGVFGCGRATLLRQWATEPSATSQRYLVESVPTNPNAESLILSARNTLTKAADAPEGLEWDELISHVLRAPSVTVELALVDIGATDPLELVATMANLLAQAPHVRFLVAASSAVAFAEACRRHALPLHVVSDRELFFTPEETASLLRLNFPETTAETASLVQEATGGHPSLLRLAIEQQHVQIVNGTLTRNSLLNAWSPPDLSGCAAIPIYDVIGRTLAARRFSRSTSYLLAGREDAWTYVERLANLGLGQIEAVDDASPVFYWDEPWRRFLFHAGGVDSDSSVRRALSSLVASAAQRSNDHCLEVASLIDCGEIANAERLAADYIWELATSNGDLDLWATLLTANSSVLLKAPILTLWRWIIVLRFSNEARIVAQATSEAKASLKISNKNPTTRLTILVLCALISLEAKDQNAAYKRLERVSAFCTDITALLIPRATDASSGALLLAAYAMAAIGRLEESRHLTGIARAGLLSGADNSASLVQTRRVDAQILDAHANIVSGAKLEDAALSALRNAHISLPDNAPRMMPRLISLAWRHLDSGNPEKALTVLGRLDEQNSFHIEWPSKTLAEVLSRFTLGMDSPQTTFKALHHVAGLTRSRRSSAFLFRLFDESEIPAGKTLGEAVLQALLTLPYEVAAKHPRLHANVLFARAARLIQTGYGTEARSELADLERRYPGQVPVVAALIDKQLLLSIADSEATLAKPEMDKLVAAAALHAHQGWHDRAVLLSTREDEVLGGIRLGLSNSEIASALNVTVHTVRFHRANLYRKFGVHSRSALLASTSRVFVRDEA